MVSVCGAKIRWQQEGRKAPIRVQTQARWGNPSPHERQRPYLCQAQWSLWGWSALGPMPKCYLTWRAALQQTLSHVCCDQMCGRIHQGMREIKDQLLPFPSHPKTGSWEHPSFWCQMRRAGLPFLWEAGNRSSLAVASDVFDNPDHYNYIYVLPVAQTACEMSPH